MGRRTVSDPEHRERVLALPCWWCKKRGLTQELPTTGHHVHRGSEKRNDLRMIALCSNRSVTEGCHALFESEGRRFREIEEEAVVDTLTRLYPDTYEDMLKKAGR